MVGGELSWAVTVRCQTQRIQAAMDALVTTLGVCVNSRLTGSRFLCETCIGKPCAGLHPPTPPDPCAAGRPYECSPRAGVWMPVKESSPPQQCNSHMHSTQAAAARVHARKMGALELARPRARGPADAGALAPQPLGRQQLLGTARLVGRRSEDGLQERPPLRQNPNPLAVRLHGEAQLVQVRCARVAATNPDGTGLSANRLEAGLSSWVAYAFTASCAARHARLTG